MASPNRCSLLVNYAGWQEVKRTNDFKRLRYNFDIQSRQVGSFEVVQLTKLSYCNTNKKESDIKEELLKLYEAVNEKYPSKSRGKWTSNTVVIGRDDILTFSSSKYTPLGKEFYQITTDKSSEKEKVVSYLDTLESKKERPYHTNRGTKTSRYPGGQDLLKTSYSSATGSSQSQAYYDPSRYSGAGSVKGNQRVTIDQKSESGHALPSSSSDTSREVLSGSEHHQTHRTLQTNEISKNKSQNKVLSASVTYDSDEFAQRYPEVYQPYAVEMEVDFDFKNKNNVLIYFHPKYNQTTNRVQFFIRVSPYRDDLCVDWDNVHAKLKEMRYKHEMPRVRHTQYGIGDANFHQGKLTYQSTATNTFYGREGFIDCTGLSNRSVYNGQYNKVYLTGGTSDFDTIDSSGFSNRSVYQTNQPIQHSAMSTDRSHQVYDKSYYQKRFPYVYEPYKVKLNMPGDFLTVHNVYIDYSLVGFDDEIHLIQYDLSKPVDWYTVHTQLNRLRKQQDQERRQYTGEGYNRRY